jgi:hypothetical protein
MTDALACLPVPSRAYAFSSFLLNTWWLMLLFLVKKFTSLLVASAAFSFKNNN